MTEVIFEVKLPPERFLYTEIDPLYPAGSINYTDGSSIIFQWNLGLTEDETKLFVVLYQLPGLTTTPQTSYIPLFLTNNSSLNPLLFVLIFLAGLGVGIFGFYLYHRNRLVETVSDTSLTLLNEAEVEIIRVIASSEEKRVTQKEIQKATNYSKAKVSITLSILEKKGFIKKESRGRTNIVTLLRDIRV
ncbi:MAG: helix-turn-helix transcriptional regulator [Candidatus Lokiarchaeia archaeon]